MKYLRFFLQAECNYTQGAVLATCAAARFRDNVLNEVLQLERELEVSIHPLRATNLRAQKARLRELLEQYEAKSKGAPTPH